MTSKTMNIATFNAFDYFTSDDEILAFLQACQNDGAETWATAVQHLTIKKSITETARLLNAFKSLCDL